MKRTFLAIAAVLGLAAHASFNTALDCTSLTFTTGGDADWFKQSDDVKVGTAALRSGAITDSQATWLETTATNAGTVSFWWKVSSESWSDYLEVSVDGEQKAMIDGEDDDWTRRSLVVAAGQTIQWRYLKDGSESDGSDCGWLDGVEFMPAPKSMKITFETNGGDAIAPTNVTPGTLYGDLPIPEKVGDDVFVGWYLDEELTARAWNDDLVAYSNATLYARWLLPVSLLDTEDITFETTCDTYNEPWVAVEGSGASGGYALRAPISPESKWGYLKATLSGPGTLAFRCKVDGSMAGYLTHLFYVDGTQRSMTGSGLGFEWTQCEVTVYDGTVEWSSSGSQSAVMLSDFVWTPAPESMTITFETNGGDAIAPTNVTPGTLYGDLPIPERVGAYVFAGWYLDEELTTMAWNDDLVAYSNATLYARWRLPVSQLNTADLTFATGEEAGYEDETPWEAAEGAGASGGYALHGPNGGSGHLCAWVDGPGTLAFKWKSAVQPYFSKSVCGPTLTLWANGVPDYSFGNEFKKNEWSDHEVTIFNADYPVIWGSDGPDSPVLSDFVWTPAPESMTISFETNGGDALAQTNVVPGTTYGDLPVPTRTDGEYEFVGWYLDEGLTQRVVRKGNNLIPYHDATLYAKWAYSASLLDTEDVRFSSPDYDYWGMLKESGATGGWAIANSVTCWREDLGELSLDVPNTNGTVSFFYKLDKDEAAYLNGYPVNERLSGTAEWKEVQVDVKTYVPRWSEWDYDLEDYVYYDDPAPERRELYLWVDSWNDYFVAELPAGAVMFSDFKWTPAPERVTISFDSRGGSAAAPVEVETAGGEYPRLPTPSRNGWTFVGWYTGAGKYVYEGSELPYRDTTLYAAWEKPVSAMNTQDMKFTASGPWTAYEDFEATPIDDLDGAPVSYVAYGELSSEAKVTKTFKPKTVKSFMQGTMTGPMLLSFKLSTWEISASGSLCAPDDSVKVIKKGSCKFTLYLDGKAQTVFSMDEDERKHTLLIPAGKHTVKWELSGTPHFVAKGNQYLTKASGDAEVSDFKVVRLDPQADMASWVRMLKTNRAWITGDLAKFAAIYKARFLADGEDYEARILYALARLASLAENAQFKAYAKTFGYTPNFMRLSVTGSLKLNKDTAAPNAMADKLLSLAAPVIDDAQDALAGIHADWAGSVKIAADEWPVDEDIYIDLADVVFARASLSGTLASLNYLAAYDLNVDWAKMNTVRKEKTLMTQAQKFRDLQPSFFSKVRNASCLSASRAHFGAALATALEADGFVALRPDDGLMHFFEYDPEDAKRVAFCRDNTQRALEAIYNPITVDFVQTASDFDNSFSNKTAWADYDYTLLPNDGVTQLYLGALFEGRITRALLPPTRLNNAGELVPDFDAMQDPTIGGLFPEMTHANVADMSRRFENSHELDHGEPEDLDSLPKPGEKLILEYADYKGYTASGFPKGWKWDSKKGVLSGTAASTFTVTFSKRGKPSQKVTVEIGPKPSLLLFVDNAAAVAVTGTGLYNVGATAKATAAVRNGFAFGGWYDEAGELVSPQAVYSFKMTREDVRLTARTLPLNEDRLYAKPVMEPYALQLGEDCGDLTPFQVRSGSPFTVAVSGLPAGLTASNAVERDEYEFSGDMHITGAPKKAGVYYTTFVAKNNGGYKWTAVVKFVVGGAVENEVNTANIDWTLLGESHLEVGSEFNMSVTVPSSAKGSAPKSIKAKGVPGGMKATLSGSELRFGGVPASAGKFTLDVTVTYANKKTARSVKTFIVHDRGGVYIPTGVLDNDPNDNVRGTVAYVGVKQYGQTVKFTATTNDKKKWFFGGWFVDEGCTISADEAIPGVAWQSATLSALIGEEWSSSNGMYARFVTKAEEVAEGVRICCDDFWRVKDAETEEAVPLPVEVVSATKATLTASGLPAGTKLSGRSLIVSKAASLVPGEYVVTLTAKTAAGNTVKKQVAVFVPNNTTALDEGVLSGLNTSDEGYTSMVRSFMQAGVKQEFLLEDIGVSVSNGWTLAVTGLPKGWSFDARTGKFSGVATKVGKTTVTFTVSKKVGKKTIAYKATATFDLDPLPVWATGAFVGMAGNAYVRMDVAANGAISGYRFDTAGKKTFTATGFTDVDGVFSTTLKGKGVSLGVEVRPEESGNLGVAQGRAEFATGGSAINSPWNIEGAEPLPVFADAASFETAVGSGTLVLKFGAKGAVTCTYLVGRNATSGSTQICDIIWDGDAKEWAVDVAVALAVKKDKKGKVLVPALVGSFRLRLPADDEGNVVTDSIEEIPLN